MDNLKIVVLAGYSFPIGLAATTRIIAYSKGLIANGAKVEIIDYGHVSPDDPLKDADSGVIDGVPYRYSYKRIGSKSKFKRWCIDYWLSRLKAISLLYKMKKESSVDYVFLSFDSIIDITCFVLPLFLIRLKLVFIGDEYPIPIRHKLKSDIPVLKKKFYRFFSRFLCARVLMTENLKQYYNRIYTLPTHILSTIVDVDRFEFDNLSSRVRKRDLTYMGNMELSKDNVDNIIKAFAKILDIFPDLTLKLYGPKNNDTPYLESLIHDLGLNDKVQLAGKVDYDDVPDVLMHSLLLVSSQPDTVRANGGFPTKLGEYLCAGTPTVMTDSGEISTYVKDAEQLWLVRPESVEEYAEKLIMIIGNYSEALAVAGRGRAYVMKNCSGVVVGKGLIDFLSNL